MPTSPRSSTGQDGRCTTWRRCLTSRSAGAIATATHGSGNAKGNLATAVRAIEMVGAGGELVTVAHGDADFAGVVVGLGALGIVTRVTLEVQPFFQMRQRVFEGVSWDTLFERFEAIFGAGESVSVFHLCGAATEQVWVKRRSNGDAGDDGDLEELLGVRGGGCRAASGAGRRPRQLHRAAGRARAVV